MGQNCISIGGWVVPALGVCLLAGILIGLSLRFCVDRAELAAYRRIARSDLGLAASQKPGV